LLENLFSNKGVRSSRLLSGATRRTTSGCSTRAPVVSVSEASETTTELKDKWTYDLTLRYFRFYLIEAKKLEKPQYPLVLLPVFCYVFD